MADSPDAAMRIVTLDLDRINDPALLDEWDRVWVGLYEARLHLSRTRRANKSITLELMQEYEQARNTEREFFWDNFYQQHEDSQV